MARTTMSGKIDKLKAQGLMRSHGAYARFATLTIQDGTARNRRDGGERMAPAPKADAHSSTIASYGGKVTVLPSGVASGLKDDIGRIGKARREMARGVGGDGGARRSTHGKRLSQGLTFDSFEYDPNAVWPIVRR